MKPRGWKDSNAPDRAVAIESWNELHRKYSSMVRNAKTVCTMLELGDGRLLASDGPAGGQLPDLTPLEWGRVYRACQRIMKAAQ